MGTIPSPPGLPVDLGLSFETLTFVWGLTALVMLAGLAILLWAVRARDQVTYRIQCPEHGTEAIIEIRTRRSGEADVTRCSLCQPPTHVDCEKRCLRLVA